LVTIRIERRVFHAAVAGGGGGARYDARTNPTKLTAVKIIFFFSVKLCFRIIFLWNIFTRTEKGII
jgi:hypothetical protein